MYNQKWYESPFSDDSPIISSRVRFARNLKKYNFPSRLPADRAKMLINEVTSSIKNDAVSIADSFEKIDINSLTQIQLNSLMENHIISPEFVNTKQEKAVLVNNDHSVGIMINEEDHIRLQTITPGDKIDDAFNLANNIDNLIEESVEYAFDDVFGYLTACPTNTGTAMRSSFMLHIPALEMTGQLMNVIQTVNKFGMTIRGIYGEGSKSSGNIYQISNQITLGKSEEEIIAVLKNLTAQIIEQEKVLRNNLLADKTKSMENKIYRSYGVLSYCKKIDTKEAMLMLSDIRFGFNEGILNLPHPKKTIYNIMMNIQPGNLQRRAGRNLNEIEMETMRAEYIQQCLKETNS